MAKKTRQIKLVDYTIKRLEKRYITAYSAVLDEVKGLVLDTYSKLGEKPLLSHLYQFRRYTNLLKAIQRKLTSLGVKQEKIFTEEMERYYKANCEILADEFEKPFKLTDERIKEIVHKDFVDYNLWSDSIWKDKGILFSRIKKELIVHVSTGKSIDAMADALNAENLTSNFYNCKRLVRQEVQRYYRQTTQERYKDYGVEEVVWHEVMDDRTCEVCKPHNNEIIPIDKVPIGGWHIQCRGWYSPVIK